MSRHTGRFTEKEAVNLGSVRKGTAGREYSQSKMIMETARKMGEKGDRAGQSSEDKWQRIFTVSKEFQFILQVIGYFFESRMSSSELCLREMLSEAGVWWKA